VAYGGIAPGLERSSVCNSLDSFHSLGVHPAIEVERSTRQQRWISVQRLEIAWLGDGGACGGAWEKKEKKKQRRGRRLEDLGAWHVDLGACNSAVAGC